MILRRDAPDSELTAYKKIIEKFSSPGNQGEEY